MSKYEKFSKEELMAIAEKQDSNNVERKKSNMRKMTSHSPMSALIDVGHW